MDSTSELAADVDVVIVGAGAAGTHAAHLLSATTANSTEKAISVCVVEALDRVGGRLAGREVRGYSYDIGGQWAGPTQNRLYARLKELGLETFRQWEDGKKGFMKADGSVVSYSGTIPPVNPFVLVETQLFLWRIDWWVRSLFADMRVEAWKSHRPDVIREWDQKSMQQLIDELSWMQGTRDMMTQCVRAVLTCEPCDVSVLNFVHYARQARDTADGSIGTLMRLINVADGAQQDRVKGGMFQLPVLTAKELGGAVFLGEPVTTIRQHFPKGVELSSELDTGERVDVISRTGRVFRGRFCIVSAPPVACASVQFSPPLAPMRNELCQRTSMGRVIKCFAFYNRRFWKEDSGMCGELVSQNDVVTMAFDGTLPDGRNPLIVAFLCGDIARQLGDSSCSNEIRRDLVLKCLAKFIGNEALRPVEYMDQNWLGEPYIGGGYTCILSAGTLTAGSAIPPGIIDSNTIAGDTLRCSSGLVHWAGSETARVWTGYIDGALESGERAAAEVRARLQGNVAWSKYVENEQAIISKAARSSATQRHPDQLWRAGFRVVMWALGLGLLWFLWRIGIAAHFC